MSVQHIHWMGVLETGIAELDDEHRQLIGEFNALLDLSAQLSPGAGIAAAAGSLVDHLIAHFAREEQILERLHFPRHDKHRLQHGEIELRLCNFLTRLRDAGASGPATLQTVLEELHALLIEVLVRHDLDYKSYVQNVLSRQAAAQLLQSYTH